MNHLDACDFIDHTFSKVLNVVSDINSGAGDGMFDYTRQKFLEDQYLLGCNNHVNAARGFILNCMLDGMRDRFREPHERVNLEDLYQFHPLAIAAQIIGATFYKEISALEIDKEKLKKATQMMWD